MRNRRRLQVITFVFYFILPFYSCIFDSKFRTINEDFEIGYIEMPDNTDIYYKDQGIFPRLHVVAYGYNDKYIWVSAKNNMQDPNLYYLVDLNGYRENPDQLNSNAVIGPYGDLCDFELVAKSHEIKFVIWRKFN